MEAKPMTVEEAQFQLDILEFVHDMSDMVDEQGRRIFNVSQSPVLRHPENFPAITEFRAIVDAYLDAHPGTLQGPRANPTYSFEFVKFVIELLQPGQVGGELDKTEICAATGIPLATLLKWFQRKPYRIRGWVKQRSGRRRRS
jgi:hypothetical protein